MDTHGMWALKDPGRDLIGRVGFFEFPVGARPEIAFLLRSESWGRGYATEATRAALAWGFGHHPWRECIALVRPGNRGALRVCAKLGMKQESTLELHGHTAARLRVER